ncbi:hypothetical protein FBU30_005503 [Linnemannia zychae]|nr:hypothetical protein FBU30_005503 [Linnemannia zychae]
MVNHKQVAPSPISSGSDSGQDESSNTPARIISTGSNKHLALNYYDFMLDWLERDDNNKRIFGASGKTIIGKDTETSCKAYQEWANHVNLIDDLQLTTQSVKNRFGQYYARYKTIKSNEHLTGSGLTEEDYKDEVTTIAKRYETDSVNSVDTSKLAWEKEKWEKEAAVRNQELESNLETQRLSAISDFLKQGIAHKDLFAQILSRTERATENTYDVDEMD